MFKNIKLLLFIVGFSFFTKGQSITINSVSPAAISGESITVNFTYTSAIANNYIFVGINLYDDATIKSFLVGGNLSNQSAGTDISTSITIAIPANAIPSADLPDLEKYLISIELKDQSDFSFLAGDYPLADFNIAAPDTYITFTTPTLTKGLIGNTIQIDYKYNIPTDGNIYCALNLYADAADSALGNVVQGNLSPASAGSDVTGSFFFTIPPGTTPTMDLTGTQNYRIVIILSDGSFDFLIGKFPADQINLTKMTSWTGDVDTDWSKKANWDVDVPNSSSIVTVPASKTVIVSTTTGASVNDLTIDGTSSLSVNAEGSLLVAGTSTGNITYNVNVADTNWHLISSPVIGAQYDNTWVTNNDIASGSVSVSNKGISTYSNGVVEPVTSRWSYFQGGTAETFGTGVGYALKKGTAGGTYSFTGTIASSVTPTITQDDNNWNLIGNTYPSYMDIAAFIASNGLPGTDKLSDTFQSVYVWNATTSLYEMFTTGYLQPGQAFFVNSKVSSGTVSITTAMQSHQTTTPFYKTSTPTLNLSVSNGSSTKKTQINYFNDKTNGLDPGFDIGMFNGVASDLSIYTHLIENNESIALGRQALAISEMESQIIPIGLKAEAGKEITFSIEALNLPNGIQVYLEDREANTFRSLTGGDLKIILNEDVNGTGKYYLQLSSNALSLDKDVLESVSVYTTSNSNLRIVGLPIVNTSVKLYNLIGKEVYSTSFKSNNIQNISLSKLSKGLYIVQIQSERSVLNKKIILE
jgi:hypothetical protein